MAAPPSSTPPRCSTTTSASRATRRTGVGIVRRATAEPLRWIAENAGEQGYVVVSKVRELPVGHGYNAATDEYVDLIAAGVIDPVKVTRSALANAASIAALLLTTEALVVEKKEESTTTTVTPATATRTARVGTATDATRVTTKAPPRGGAFVVRGTPDMTKAPP